MSNVFYQKPNGELPKEQKELTPKGKNSVMSIIALILSITGILFFIGAILAIIDLCQKNGRKKTISIIALVICAFWVLAIAGSDSDTSSDQPATAEVIETDVEAPSESIEETTEVFTEEETTTIPEEPTVPTESKEDFIASCQPFDYREYARYAEEHVGDRITVTVKISQILQGGLFDDNQYYRVYTNDEYDMWLGEELFMNDFRVDDATRLLEEDILVIYGEFGGMTNVERALSGTTEEVPTINAFYIDIMGIEDHAAEPAHANDLAVNDVTEQSIENTNTYIEPVAEVAPSLDEPSPTPVDDPTPVIDPAPVVDSTPTVDPAPQPTAAMVWVDDTAKRYHKANGCGMDNAYQVTVDEAIAMGKTPCGRCYK